MSYTTYLDLQTAVLNKIGITDDDVTTVVKQALNDALQEICQAHNFSWLYGDSSFITVSPYEAGTVSVTQGSKTVTGTNTTFTSAMVGRKFICGGATYVIESYTSATQITLYTQYAGSTASGLTYKIYQDEYSLASDVEDVLSVRQENNPAKIQKVGIEVLDYYYPKRILFGNPSVYSIIGEDSSGNIKIALYPIPNISCNIYYRYKKRVTEMSADSDTCIIPQRYRWVLVKGALYMISKNPLEMFDMGRDIEREYRNGISQIIAADNKSDERIVKGDGIDIEEGTFIGDNYPIIPL